MQHRGQEGFSMVLKELHDRVGKRATISSSGITEQLVIGKPSLREQV